MWHSKTERVVHLWKPNLFSTIAVVTILQLSRLAIRGRQQKAKYNLLIQSSTSSKTQSLKSFIISIKKFPRKKENKKKIGNDEIKEK